jgi:hypothetical protein
MEALTPYLLYVLIAEAIVFFALGWFLKPRQDPTAEQIDKARSENDAGDFNHILDRANEIVAAANSIAQRARRGSVNNPIHHAASSAVEDLAPLLPPLPLRR